MHHKKVAIDLLCISVMYILLCVRACVCVCLDECVYLRMHVYVCFCVCSPGLILPIYVHACMPMLWGALCMCVCVCVSMPCCVLCACVCVYLCVSVA